MLLSLIIILLFLLKSSVRNSCVVCVTVNGVPASIKAPTADQIIKVEVMATFYLLVGALSSCYPAEGVCQLDYEGC